MASSIRLAPSGEVFDCDDDDTLLRAGQRAGLALPYECNVGSCGTCKVELVEGEVDVAWPDAPGLSARDRERRRILACQSRPRAPCTVKARLLDQYRPVVRAARFRATLAGIEPVTHDIREFRFVAAAAPAFRPGQYALMRVASLPSLRAYSMCNVDDGSGAWHFQIRRVPGGSMTAALFERLSPGDSVELDGPWGHAWLRTDSARDIACIAGGSGLSPMVSIARGAARERALAGVRLHFFYGGRGPLDICGEPMLRELPGFGERVFYHPVVSMPELDTGGAWKGAVGFVHEHASQMLGDALARHEVYFAGPPAMTQAVQAMLLRHGVPPAQMHFDQFF